VNPKAAGLYVLGGAAVMLYLERFTKVKDPGSAQRIFIPEEREFQQNKPAFQRDLQPSAAAPRPAPMLVRDSPINVVPGQTYHVTLVTHRAANVASEGQVVREAQNRGFTNVSVSKGKPVGWPGSMNGDWYVSALYAGGPKTQARTEGGILGSVDVVEVWQG
jgi:hypothetical protein